MKVKTVLVASLVAVLAIGAWLFARHSRSTADSELQKQRVYQVVKRHEPEVYARLVQRYEASRAGTITAREFTNFANGAVSEVATQRLRNASDASVNALIHHMLENARLLAKQPGDACFRYLFPQVSGPPDVARLLDPAAQARTQDLLAEVIRSAHESPVEAPVSQAVREQMADAINAIYRQFGADTRMMSQTDDPRIDRAKVCAMTIAWYQQIMARPPADSSALVRAMTQAN